MHGTIGFFLALFFESAFTTTPNYYSSIQLIIFLYKITFAKLAMEQKQTQSQG